MTSWSDVKAGWSAGWKALDAEARRVYGAALQSEPAKYAAKVKAFVTELAQARSNLDAIRRKLPNPPRTAQELAAVEKYKALDRRYNELAAGFYADARPATEHVGAAPLMVVGGIAAGLAACAWAVAAYEYAVNLREQTALADRELTARIEASQQGRTLPPSTLPPQPEGKGWGLGALLVGGLVLTAGAIAVPAFLKR